MNTNQKSKTDSAQLILESLHGILYYPVKISQLTGSFIFSLEPNAEMSFSWFALPFILVVCKIALGSIFYVLFWLYKEEYVVTFGNWSDVDLFTYTSMASVGFCSDILCSINAILYRNRIIKFHNELVQFTMQVQSESVAKDSQLLDKYLKTFKKSKNTFLGFVTISIIFASFSFLSALSTSLVIGIKLVASRTFIVITVPIVLFFAVLLSIVRNSQYYIISSALTFISFALGAISDQLKWETLFQRNDTFELEKILQHYKRTNCIIKDVNSTFKWILVTGMLTLLFNTLCALFETFAWIPAVGLLITIIVIFPMLPPVITPLYSVCKAAVDIRKEVMKNIYFDIKIVCRFFYTKILFDRQLVVLLLYEILDHSNGLF